jgi:CBS domain-containing protein
LSTVALDAVLTEAAIALCETHRALIVVCDDNGALAGVLTKTDVVRHVARSPEVRGNVGIESVMTRDVTCCRASHALDEVLGLMSEKGFIHIPVVDQNGRPLGVVNARDVLQALLQRLQREELLLRAYIIGVGYR